MSELNSPYPRSDFVDRLANQAGFSPLATELVRSIYLAQFFGQQHPELTDTMAAEAPKQAYFWFEDEKQQYHKINEEITGFFANGDGAVRLAEASLADAELSVAERQEAQGVRSVFLGRSWQAFRQHRPKYEELQGRVPTHQLIKRRLRPSQLSDDETNAQIKWDIGGLKKAVRVGRLLVAVDAESMTRGRQPGMFEHEPHESLTRIAVLDRCSTGVGHFNLLMTSIGDVCLFNPVKTELRAARRVWNSRHPGEEFYPPAYRGRRESVSLLDSLLLKTLLWVAPFKEV